ncbi:MAG TPA: MmgE/PrpD family protein [Clostridia bacterium]
MSISRTITEMLFCIDYKDISEKAVHAAKNLLLDSLGTAIAGNDAPGVEEVLSLLSEWGGAPQAGVFTRGIKLPVPNAVFINSTMVHALDFDDVHRPAALHITSSVVPVALAAGELMHSSGKDVLRSIVLGIECAARLGTEYFTRVKHFGFLPSSVIGGFGAAITACILLGMTVDQTVNALGIYYSHASGNRQALYDLTLTKRIQPAIAAKAAVFSAFLANKGVTGPENAFEGQAGLYNVYADSGVPEEASLVNKRDFYEVERVTIKRFPTCGADHAAIMAALDLHRTYGFSFDDISEIGVYVGEGGNPMVGNAFVMEGNLQVNAQFSAPYAVALALLRGRVGIQDISDEQIRKDTEVAQLASKVEIIKHWDYEKPDIIPDGIPAYYFDKQMVRVKTREGKVYEKARTQRDWIQPDLVSDNDILEKFLQNAEYSKTMKYEDAEKIAEEIKRLDEIGDITVAEWFRLIMGE